MVDLDSNPTKLIEIVEVGKQLLITRGALTTFSIANDVAKYFAILPAIFAATYAAGGDATGPLDALNIMNLGTPRRAIISAIVFNALIIPLLVPLALRGVRYRPVGATALLRRNLLIYGLGGLIAPFVGIKLIDLVVHNLLGSDDRRMHASPTSPPSRVAAAWWRRATPRPRAGRRRRSRAPTRRSPRAPRGSCARRQRARARPRPRARPSRPPTSRRSPLSAAVPRQPARDARQPRDALLALAARAARRRRGPRARASRCVPAPARRRRQPAATPPRPRARCAARAARRGPRRALRGRDVLAPDRLRPTMPAAATTRSSSAWPRASARPTACCRRAAPSSRRAATSVIGYSSRTAARRPRRRPTGLEVVPRRRVTYRDTVLEEMDLPRVLARAPELCLIDELAHTNAPGRRARQALRGRRGRARRRGSTSTRPSTSSTSSRSTTRSPS